MRDRNLIPIPHRETINLVTRFFFIIWGVNEHKKTYHSRNCRHQPLCAEQLSGAGIFGSGAVFTLFPVQCQKYSPHIVCIYRGCGVFDSDHNL